MKIVYERTCELNLKSDSNTLTLPFFLFDIQSGNNTNKDSSNQKAESGALIEVAKSKIHQVSVCI